MDERTRKKRYTGENITRRANDFTAGGREREATPLFKPIEVTRAEATAAEAEAYRMNTYIEGGLRVLQNY